MSEDSSCESVLLFITCLLAIFAFFTITSPGFLLYGFFSTEWLIENATRPTNGSENDDYGIYRTTTPDPDDKIHHGLYLKCYHGNCVSESKSIVYFVNRVL